MINEIKKQKIKSFMDLIVWQEAHKLVIMVYLTTKSFPKEETYSLVDQIRRAATSITANIAEGFGRQSFKEKIQFYYVAKGSLEELRNFLLVARDIEYIDRVKFQELWEKSIQVEQLISKFISKSKTFINHDS